MFPYNSPGKKLHIFEHSKRSTAAKPTGLQYFVKMGNILKNPGFNYCVCCYRLYPSRKKLDFFPKVKLE